MPIINDEYLKDLEKRARAGKVTAKEMKEVFPSLVAMLRVRTRKLIEVTKFAKAVAPEDVLYVPAYGVWRRKVEGKGGVVWVRANHPKELLPEPPTAPTEPVPGLLPPGPTLIMDRRGPNDGLPTAS